MAITKIGTTFLQGFKDIKPTKSYQTNNYELTINKNYFHLNKECFNHFKGSTDLKIAYNKNKNAIAIINTYHDDPNLLCVSLNHKNKYSCTYNNVTNLGILNHINNYFPQLKLSRGYINRIIADKNGIGKNYIIFTFDRKHNKQYKKK